MKTIIKNALLLALMTGANLNGLHAVGFGQGSGQAKVTLHLPDTLKEDSLQLLIFGDNYLDFPFLEEIKVTQTIAPVTHGICAFTVAVDNGPKYFAVRRKGGAIGASAYSVLENNLIEESDSVHIDLSNNEVSFTGKGSEKMREMDAFKKEYKAVQKLMRESLSNVPNFVNKEMEYAYRIIKVSQLKVDYWANRLTLEKENFSPEAYGFLMAEFIGQIQEGTMLSLLYRAVYSGFSPPEINKIRGWVDNALYDVRGKVPDTLISKSASWMRYSQKLGQFESYTNKGHTSSYDYYKKHYSGKLKERILTDYLFRVQGNTSSDSLFHDAVTVIKDPYYLSEIAYFLKKQGRGERAADFSLFNANGDAVSLSNFKGKVVFLDFWFVGCAFCKSYFKNAVHPAEEFFRSDTSVVFVSICVEKDREKWIKNIKENTYTSSHSVNLYTGSLAWLHPVIKQYAVVSAPKPLLIDKRGFIYTRSDADLGRLEPTRLIHTIQTCLTQ